MCVRVCSGLVDGLCLFVGRKGWLMEGKRNGLWVVWSYGSWNWKEFLVFVFGGSHQMVFAVCVCKRGECESLMICVLYICMDEVPPALACVLWVLSAQWGNFKA